MPKVLWGEGLALLPQHFQQQDAHHEARLRERAATLHPYAWGIHQVLFDTQGLATGRLRAMRLSAVFPDGESYSAPGHDLLPEPLSLAHLPVGVQVTTIHLALPLWREHGANHAPGGTTPARFASFARATADLYSDTDEADIMFLHKSPRLITDAEPRDAFVTLPVARVQRTASGEFEFDEHFVPPFLCLAAAPPVLLQLRRLLDAMQAKTDALYGHHRQPSQSIIEFRSGDIASFWLLHTLNASFGPLSHLFHHPGLHPERLFSQLLELAGALLTFSNLCTLAELPKYDHAAPQAGFEALFGLIRELIDTVISARFVVIGLNQVKPSYYLGRIDSQRIDASASLYLAVAADMPAPELVQATPLRFKIGAPDDVESAVLSALPGVPLSHVSHVPAAIPVRPGHHYFAIEPRGPLYERMLKSESITVYVPEGLRDLKLELFALVS